MPTRPDRKTVLGSDPCVVPLSAQRILKAETQIETVWISPEQSKKLTASDQEMYALAHTIMKYLAIEAPRAHRSGHPGGALSAFTCCFGVLKRRDPQQDASLRMSPGHLSVLAYGLQYLGGRGSDDPRLQSPQGIIDAFRTSHGLPGHVEAGIGDIPFGFGPLGKGLSNALGNALGWRMQKRSGITDVLIGDGDAQEGQVLEAARLASKLKLDTLVVHADVNDMQLSTVPSRVAASDLATLFQSMGWAVIEVQNGNEPGQVEAALDVADSLIGKGRPIFVCYYTTMGFGVETIEKAANAGLATYHGSPLSDADAEKELKKLPPLPECIQRYEQYRVQLQKRFRNAPRASDVLKPVASVQRTLSNDKGAARRDFGAIHILNLMRADTRIVVLHGDLAGSGGFDVVEREFPERVINCGAAEANMYMVAAGLRQAGMLPVTYTFAAFGTNEARANARLIDINAGHIPCSVLHDCTHAGLSVGEDGETHQDRNFLNLPFDRTQVWFPADSNQAAAAAERGFHLVAEGTESVFVFFARSSHEQLRKQDGSVFYDSAYVFDGSADIVYGGNATDVATIIATGMSVHEAVAAAKRLSTEHNKSVRVLNVACIRPLDAASIVRCALETTHLIVVEDHNSEGGLASQVADVIADFQLPVSLRRLGVNHYFPSAPAADLLLFAGLDEESICHAVLDEIHKEVRNGEEALVTVFYSLVENARLSRFSKSVQPFIQQCLSHPGYIDDLRSRWSKRKIDEVALPTTVELHKRLEF